MTLAERIATTERAIRAAWENRRYAQSTGDVDEARHAAWRIRFYIDHLRGLDRLAARLAQKIAAE